MKKLLLAILLLVSAQMVSAQTAQLTVVNHNGCYWVRFTMYGWLATSPGAGCTDIYSYTCDIAPNSSLTWGNPCAFDIGGGTPASPPVGFAYFPGGACSTLTDFQWTMVEYTYAANACTPCCPSAYCPSFGTLYRIGENSLISCAGTSSLSAGCGASQTWAPIAYSSGTYLQNARVDFW